jgi:HD superfamily phosphohydrolase
MIYQDRIYGTIQIENPVLLELIAMSSLQRLKGIDQSGYFEPYFSGTSHSRFEHSLGVCILLIKFGAPLEEQIAGLIHDVSHPVFSHCIDYALDEGSETEHNFQDKMFEDFIKKSEIPKILEKHKINLDYILDESNFPLKERPLPDLCADRIDYSLRTAVIFKEIKQIDAIKFIDNLVIIKKNWVFKDRKIAKSYAELFKKINILYYSGPPTAAMFRTVGDVIKYAMKKSYINKNDIFSTDEKIIKKIRKFQEKDDKLRLLFRRMNGEIKFKLDENNYDAIVFCKSRIVDPLFKHNSSIKRLSEVDDNWTEIVKKESLPKKYFLKFGI